MRRLDDTVTAGRFPSDDFTSEYREGIFVGYRYHQKADVPVAYPFGYGLSYTTFELGGIEIAKDVDGMPTAVTFTLSNAGERDGAEVCQLYVGKRDAQVFRPVRELKGFKKVFLKAGESAKVAIELDDKAFRYWNVKTGAWEIETGAYDLCVGTSCEDLPLSATVQLAGTGAPNPYEGLNLSAYESGLVKSVNDAQFKALLGRELPVGKVELDRNLCFRDFTRTRSPLLALVGFVVNKVVKSSEAKGAPNLNALFVYNMPIRALAKNAGQFFSMGVVDAIVREAKGWGIAGIIPALVVRMLTGKFFELTWLLWVLAPILGAVIAHLVRSSQLNKRIAKAGK